MKVIKAQHMGFCYGVKRAVDLAIKAAAVTNKNTPVETLGELIHNKQVVRWLEEHNIIVCNSLEEKNEGTIVISSHGVGPKIYEIGRKKNFKIVDATCPDVKKVQNEAYKSAMEVKHVIIVGDKNHPEVKSIMEWSGRNYYVIGDVDEVNNLPTLDCVGIVAQTTFIGEQFNAIITEFKKRCKNIKVKRTTCLATIRRQAAAVEVAKQSDIMLVIGGKHSANTKHLAQLCKQFSCIVYHIEQPDELKIEWFKNKNIVGITAGASTPDWIIKGVEKNLEKQI